MVYQRNSKPDEKTVVSTGKSDAEKRVTYDAIPNEVAIEHATGKQVHQGLRFKDKDVVDRLIDALEDYRERMEGGNE